MMPPLRMRRFQPASPGLFARRNGNYGFISTCAILCMRQRPGRPSRRNASIGAPASEDSEASTASTPRPPKENAPSTSPELTRPATSPGIQPRQQEPLKIFFEPSLGALSEATNRAKPPKRPSLRGAKPFQEQLFYNESLCYQPGSPLPAEVPRSDKPPMMAAEKFFSHRCQLLYSAESIYHHPRNDHIPELIVLGASNAGKSSFLNALVGDTGVARVSQRPGRTVTMNAYGIGPRPKIARDLVRKGDAPPKHSLILMDTPGYGFRSQSEWGKTVLKYLDMRKMLRGAVLLIPADKKKLLGLDRWMLSALAESNTRTLIVLTKADKGEAGWSDACGSLANAIRQEMRDIQSAAGNGWVEGSGWSADIYATAANMSISQKLGNGGGLGGVRLALLEMAGYSIRERVEKRPETAAYSGPVVSFDDIKWKV